MSQEYIWSCVRQHENQPNNPTRSLFVGSSQRQWGGSFTHCATHSGRGRACNMKVFVLGSDLMWWQHILMSNSWPSRCPSCDNPVRPCFHSAFRRSSERHVTCCKNDWFSKSENPETCCKFHLGWDTLLSKLHLSPTNVCMWPALLSGKMILFRGFRKTRTKLLPTGKPHFLPFSMKILFREAENCWVYFESKR